MARTRLAWIRDFAQLASVTRRALAHKVAVDGRCAKAAILTRVWRAHVRVTVRTPSEAHIFFFQILNFNILLIINNSI